MEWYRPALPMLLANMINSSSASAETATFPAQATTGCLHQGESLYGSPLNSRMTSKLHSMTLQGPASSRVQRPKVIPFPFKPCLLTSLQRVGFESQLLRALQRLLQATHHGLGEVSEGFLRLAHAIQPCKRALPSWPFARWPQQKLQEPIPSFDSGPMPIRTRPS